MDSLAFITANRLVGNAPDAAAIEIRSPITLQADDEHLIALAGADSRFLINDRVMPTWTGVFVRAGSIIQVIPNRAGGWMYLAVRGGIDVPLVLGSRSTFLRGRWGGLGGRALQAGDILAIGKSTGDLNEFAGNLAPDHVRAFADREMRIRIVLGPHVDWFSSDAISALTSDEFTLTDIADRMGYRLSGPTLTRSREGELMSCGVPLGAIQVPSDGQPIILMADHQTTGGYPIIATVIRADVSILAQRAPGDSVRFQIIEIVQAQRLYSELMNP
jgi:antagonist of KipI